MRAQALFSGGFGGAEAVWTLKSASARRMMHNGGIIMPNALPCVEDEHVSMFSHLTRVMFI